MVTMLLILILAVLLFGAAVVKNFLSGILKVVLAVIIITLCAIVYERFTYVIWGIFAVFSIFLAWGLVAGSIASRRARPYTQLTQELLRLQSNPRRTPEIERRLGEIAAALAPHEEKARLARQREERREAALAEKIGVEKVGNEYRLKK